MAYKDEYEVARLYWEPAFRVALDAQFTERGRVSVYLAPPLFPRTDSRTGRPAKRRFGPWILPAMGLLAKGKRLRGGWADPFGHTAERRAERALRDDYLVDIAMLCKDLTTGKIGLALELASLPETVRGFGPVKEHAIAAHAARRTALLDTIGGRLHDTGGTLPRP